MYKVASLFSGIGGIDLAFAWAGFDISVQVEIDPFCQAVLRKHAPQYWPNARIYNDVTKVTKTELGAVDVMAGGFPCQDVSQTGRRKGITEDTRSGLWFQFARLIGEVRPRVALLENVPGLLTQDGVRVLADITALGYDAQWGIMAAAGAGAPHKRERWFCVAYSLRQRCGSQRHRGECGCHRNGDASTDQQSRQSIELRISKNSSDVGDSERQRLEGRTIVGAAEKLTPRSDHQRSSGEIESRLGFSANGIPGRMDGSRFPARPGEAQYEWEAPRTIKVKEKNHKDRLKALGNAVVPQVVYPIAVAIREHLNAAKAGTNL